MKNFNTAIVGVGKGGEGEAGIHSIGYAHANAYQKNVRTEFVGACDEIAFRQKVNSDLMRP